MIRWLRKEDLVAGERLLADERMLEGAAFGRAFGVACGDFARVLGCWLADISRVPALTRSLAEPLSPAVGGFPFEEILLVDAFFTAAFGAAVREDAWGLREEARLGELFVAMA
jgi:hypothetical protein